jgi:hypothetical protein
MNKDRLQMYISVTKITIILCWLSLFAFWAIKIFGGNWFEILVENENFIKFSDAVQNTWLKYIVSLFTIGLCNFLMVGAIIQRFTFKGKDLAMIISSILIIWSVVHFVNIEFLKTSCGYIVFILIGIIKQKRFKKCFGLMAVGLDLVFSTISMLTRNVEISLIYNYTISYILSIDLYLMYMLYYLHFNLLRLRKDY